MLIQRKVDDHRDENRPHGGPASRHRVRQFPQVPFDSFELSLLVGPQGALQSVSKTLFDGVDLSLKGADLGRQPTEPRADLLGTESLAMVDRSEERRVGKECRSRWSP